MPKFGTHIIFAEGAADRRPDLFQNLDMQALRLGAVGPDATLFMFDPATKNPLVRKGFESVLEIYQSIDKIEEGIQQVVDKLSEPLEDIVSWLDGGLTADLRETLNLSLDVMFKVGKLGVGLSSGTIDINNPLFSQLQQLPADFIRNPLFLAPLWTITSVDTFGFPFRCFGHPFTDDGSWKQASDAGDYSKWWWMDLLHYRNTGAFASALIRNASGPAQESYARGYMTHVAGDVCGHPFINSIVGGPFRNHAYRHLVLESLADTWLWDRVGRGDVLGARFDSLVEVSGSDARAIARLIVRTMREVYVAPQVPSLLGQGYPTEDEWLFGYRTMLDFLKLSTAASAPRPTPPPSTPRELIDELQKLLARNTPGAPPTWRGNIEEYLKSLFSWFSKGLALLIMIATLPFAIIQRFMAIDSRWIVYLVKLGLYQCISATRTMLCLTGWGYASREDFANFSYLGDWITAPQFERGTYPVRTLPNPKPPFYWLVPPEWRHNVEDVSTVPMPSAKGKRPDWMVDSANVLSEFAVQEFGKAATAQVTRDLQDQFYNSHSFGNAIDFSIALLEGRFDPIPDFDLDGDRGYGYRGWEVMPPNETYL